MVYDWNCCILYTMKKISDIASVFFGTGAASRSRGKVSLIQSGSVSEDGQYSPERNLLISRKEIDDEDFLLAGDLLFPAKGSHKHPYIIKETDRPVVASSVFFVIRAEKSIVLPEFLAWLFTTSKMHHQLSKISEGSTITSISIREFRSVRVDIPPLKVQHKIVALQQLQKRYTELSRELQHQVNIMNQEIANQILKTHHE